MFKAYFIHHISSYVHDALTLKHVKTYMNPSEVKF